MPHKRCAAGYRSAQAPYKGTVCDILDRVTLQAEVWVFGLPGTRRARRFSDLDLLVTRTDRLSWVQRAALRDAFQAAIGLFVQERFPLRRP